MGPNALRSAPLRLGGDEPAPIPHMDRCFPHGAARWCVCGPSPDPTTGAPRSRCELPPACAQQAAMPPSPCEVPPAGAPPPAQSRRRLQHPESPRPPGTLREIWRYSKKPHSAHSSSQLSQSRRAALGVLAGVLAVTADSLVSGIQEQDHSQNQQPDQQRHLLSYLQPPSHQLCRAQVRRSGCPGRG